MSRDYTQKGGRSLCLGPIFSHPIRGSKGAAATQEDIEANNRQAMRFAAELRAEFPNLDLYVPAEHDEFVLRTYETHLLNEAEILAVDCDLLLKRDFLIVYVPDGHLSSGMMQEITAAQVSHKPIVLTAGSFAPIYCVLEGLLH